MVEPGDARLRRIQVWGARGETTRRTEKGIHTLKTMERAT
jgi:hypothetical protein